MPGPHAVPFHTVPFRLGPHHTHLPTTPPHLPATCPYTTHPHPPPPQHTPARTHAHAHTFCLPAACPISAGSPHGPTCLPYLVSPPCLVSCLPAPPATPATCLPATCPICLPSFLTTTTHYHCHLPPCLTTIQDHQTNVRRRQAGQTGREQQSNGSGRHGGAVRRKKAEVWMCVPISAARRHHKRRVVARHTAAARGRRQA